MIRRTRQCEECAHRFPTIEAHEAARLSVDQSLLAQVRLLGNRFEDLKRQFDLMLAEAEEIARSATPQPTKRRNTHGSR